MVRYLSDEWMERAAAALAGDEALAGATADADLTVTYDVSGGPDGRRAYTLRADHGRVALEAGAQDDAPVTFSLDYATAVAIARGELSAQAAFMRGDLKLGGDVGVLVREGAALDGVDDALAALRADTEF